MSTPIKLLQTLIMLFLILLCCCSESKPSPEEYYKFINLYRSKNEHQRVITIIDMALNDYPDGKQHGQFLYAKGSSYEFLNDNVRAIESFKKALIFFDDSLELYGNTLVRIVLLSLTSGDTTDVLKYIRLLENNLSSNCNKVKSQMGYLHLYYASAYAMKNSPIDSVCFHLRECIRWKPEWFDNENIALQIIGAANNRRIIQNIMNQYNLSDSIFYLK